MFGNEEFEEVGEVESGKLSIKIPGVAINLVYSEGKSYVNESGNVAYTALKIEDLTAEEFGESNSIFDISEQIIEQMNTPEARKMIEEELRGQDFYLFTSKTEDGRDVLTFPGASGDNQMDDENFEEIVISYSTVGQSMPSAGDVYNIHCGFIEGRDLAVDKEYLTESVKSLVERTQKIYDKAFEEAKKTDGW